MSYSSTSYTTVTLTTTGTTTITNTATTTATLTSTYTTTITGQVAITFAVTGIQGSDLSATAPVLYIDGVPVTYQNFYPSGNPLLTWDIGSAHSIAAGSQLLGSSYTYTFSSWTNGDGLGSASSGIYTVPSSPTTLTVNFAATPIGGGGIPVTFQIQYIGHNAPPTFTGSQPVFSIDSGVSYVTTDFPVVKSFASGSSHTINVQGGLGPMSNLWVYNGCLNCAGPSVGGSFTQIWPSTITTITFRYVQSSVITFTTIGLGADVPSNTKLATINGVDHSISDLLSGSFIFTTGQGISFQTYTPLTGTSTYNFHTWVNGGSCTTSTTCTYIVPAGQSTVSIQFGTANIVLVTFILSGFTADMNGQGLTMAVDGSYFTFIFPTTTKILTFQASSNHSISIPNSVIGFNYTYSFASWTNGHGLVTNSGTFTTPATNGTSTTANYNAFLNGGGNVAVTFTQSGLGSDVNSSMYVLQIDSGFYRKSQLPITINGVASSVHFIQAVSPIHGTSHDYAWSTWTNGIGTSSGNYVWPTSAVTVTANYGIVTVVTGTFTFTAMTLTDNVSVKLSVTQSVISTYTSTIISLPSTIPPVEVPLLQAAIWVGLCVATFGGMGYVSSKGQGEVALVGMALGTGVGVIIMVIFFQFPLYLLLLGALALVGAIWIRRG
jgi:hypothetical protein